VGLKRRVHQPFSFGGARGGGTAELRGVGEKVTRCAGRRCVRSREGARDFSARDALSVPGGRVVGWRSSPWCGAGRWGYAVRGGVYVRVGAGHAGASAAIILLIFLSWADGFEPLRKVRTCLQRLMASASNQSIFLFFLKNPRFFLYRYLHRGHLLAVWQPVLLESNVYKSKQSRETKGQSYAVNYCKKM
jgi:hypothetical protein